MDKIQPSSTPIYLPAKEALIPKLCRFCHQPMEIKQINLTEAVRQCYKCSTPFKDLDTSDIEFFRRSYRDIHKNPKDWSLKVASEEDELHSLQLWMKQVSLAVSKYEDSSDDDIPTSDTKNVAQENSVCPSDDFEFLDLVNDLQLSSNCPNTQNEWNNASMDELDAALAKASSEKQDSASLPFSIDDLFLPENLPQNVNPQLDCLFPKQDDTLKADEEMPKDGIIAGEDLKEKDMDKENDRVFICETPGKDDDGVFVPDPPKEDTEENDDCANGCNTMEKDSAVNDDEISKSPKDSMSSKEQMENKNETVTENASVNSEFHTSTPQVLSKERNYQKVQTMKIDPGQSVLVSLNSEDFVLPIETGVLSLDNTSIFTAFQTETFVPPFVCDCDDEIVQLSPLSQEKEQDHCVDFKLPDLSVSAIMEKEVFDDLEQEISCFPSDLDKIIFSPLGTFTKRGMRKCRSDIKPSKLSLDTLEHDVSEPQMDHCEKLTNSSDSILVTIPADDDITPEMLEATNLDDVPILFQNDECSESNVLQNNFKDVLVQNSFDVCFSEPEVPTDNGEVGAIVESNNDNYQSRNNLIEANVTNNAPLVVVEAGAIDNCDKVEKQVPAKQVETNRLFNAQNMTVKSDLTEQFSFSYTVCDDSVGGFRIDVNRCDLNSLVCALPSSNSAALTKDAGLEKQNLVFQSEATDNLNLHHSNVTILEPVKHEIDHCDSIEGDYIEKSNSLNNIAGPSQNVHASRVEPISLRTEERSRKFTQKAPQPLRSDSGLEEEDELKSFTGAKFSLLAKRKKEAKVEQDSKLANLMQVVQKEVTMTTTSKRKQHKKPIIIN